MITPIKWTTLINLNYEGQKVCHLNIVHLNSIKEAIQDKITAGTNLTPKEESWKAFFSCPKVQKRMYWTARKQGANSLSKSISNGFKVVLTSNM